MESVLTGLFGGVLAAWIEAALAIVGAASAIAAATPTKKDDAVLGKITRVVDVLALNIGFAKRR
ncbi:hypothetical protein [Parvibaculum sp.]|jgi:hypothetical protein|uniref:hypothetical protein n=1 Tax=Parvibaculum sp. TaxID=2024848 RepID=UPI002A2AF2BE|nr:hypothetical protein [Parvibaculum sp.]